MTVYFYTLTDPVTDEVCYIGQTNNPNAREKQHSDLRGFGGNHLKYIWLMTLSKKGLKPKLTVIYESDDADVLLHPTKLEVEFIEKYWEMGAPLLNMQHLKTKRSGKKYFEYIKRIKSAHFYQVHEINWY